MVGLLGKMDKPSFLTSTFSAITLIVSIGFTGLCIWQKDILSLKELAMLLLGGYGVKKGMEIQKNGEKPTEVK